jgi:hypothetical protein
MLIRTALISASALMVVPAAAASATTAIPGVAIQDFASQVETLGETAYGDSFAGSVLGPTGELTVYANPNTDGAFVAAVGNLNTGGFVVQYLPAAISYNGLNAMTNALTAKESLLAGDGVELLQASQNPASDSVDVTVAAPSGTAAATVPSVYESQVSALISATVGPGFTLEPAYGVPATAASSRDVGKAPFVGGSNITNNIESPTGEYFNCTSGFTVSGNNTGNDFMLTAGHCGSGTYTIGNKVGGTTLGKTSGLYISDSNLDDFQTVSETSGTGYVWIGNSTSGTSAPVIGMVDPPVGADITMDGGKTGEVSETDVYGNNATIYNLKNNYNNTTYTVAHLVESERTDGTDICQGGDSGGPAIQRTNGSGVNAVGTIVAVYAYEGESSGTACASEKISSELSESNTSLVLGP